jgi:predicted nucleotidyltransferase
LRAAGIFRLSLFGSTAREDDRPAVWERTLKPRVQENVDREAVRAF